MGRHPTRTLPVTAAVLLLLGGCVKKSEYDALQIENQTLQTRVDETNHLLVQSQADLSSLQIQMKQFLPVQTQLQKTQMELTQSQVEFKALKTQFDQFRTQRRSAMVGKKFPLLNLDDGQVLREAEITAVSAEDLSIRHADGLVNVALAKTTPDLRWEACYDPLEAREKPPEKMLVKALQMEPRLVREQVSPHQVPVMTPVPIPVAVMSAPTRSTAMPARNSVDVLRAQLASQRQALNTEYQALAAKNTAALRGVVWNSFQPEASHLLNTLSASRAVLGISHLQIQRNAILATLRQLRELDPSAR